MRLGASISLRDNDNRNVLHAIVIHGGELDKILDDEICVSWNFSLDFYELNHKYIFQTAILSSF